MTKADIVEALRCAADLCGFSHDPLREVDYRTGAPEWELRNAAWLVLCRSIEWRIEDKRHDLLEVAQRIEESK